MSLTATATITNLSPITFSIPADRYTPESSCYSIQGDRNAITLALRKLLLPTVDLADALRRALLQWRGCVFLMEFRPEFSSGEMSSAITS